MERENVKNEWNNFMAQFICNDDAETMQFEAFDEIFSMRNSFLRYSKTFLNGFSVNWQLED